MPKDNPPPIAAGAPLALIIIAGTIIGSMMHQPTIGIVAGAGVGILVAVLVWWRDSRRRGE